MSRLYYTLIIFAVLIFIFLIVYGPVLLNNFFEHIKFLEKY